MASYEFLFLKALLFTNSVELAAGLVLRFLKVPFDFAEKALTKKSAPAFVLGILFASTMTLPYVWFIFPYLVHSRTIYIIVAELFAWLTESLFYTYFFKIRLSRALLFSFILNFFSFTLGLIVF